MFSSMHKGFFVDKNQKKNLTETIEYYNKSKAGVHVLDQMSRFHTFIHSNQQQKDSHLHVSLTLCGPIEFTISVSLGPISFS